MTCLTVPANAGTPLGILKKLGTLIDTLSVKGLDRQYIDKPERPWQIIAKGNVNQSDMNIDVVYDFEGDKMTLAPRIKTEPSRYVGLWAGYRGYGFGYTVNTGGDKGSYLTFGATGGCYGANIRIHSFENSQPDLTIDTDFDGVRESFTAKADLRAPVKIRTLIADAYYLFNGKHFSYAAAYDQSVIQKRSAGSIMAGAMYYYGHINYSDNKNADLVALMKNLGRVKMWQASAGIGYAYNWVPARGLLLSAMAMPMLTFVNNIKVYGYTTNFDEVTSSPDVYDDEQMYSLFRVIPVGSETRHGNVNVNVDARFSVTYNIKRYFLNAYGQFNNFRYRHHETKGRLNAWFVNTSLGIRL